MANKKDRVTKIKELLDYYEAGSVQPSSNVVTRREREWERERKWKRWVSSIPESYWKELLSRTKVAAKRKGRECDITLGKFLKLVEASRDKCAVSGLEFSLLTVKGSPRRPFAPSVDRIDCSRGYTLDNCRLVCASVNGALSDWGDGVLYAIAAAMVEKFANAEPPPLLIDQIHKPNAPKNRMPEVSLEARWAAVNGLGSHSG